LNEKVESSDSKINELKQQLAEQVVDSSSLFHRTSNPHFFAERNNSIIAAK
jgi:hypothetical protein